MRNIHIAASREAFGRPTAATFVKLFSLFALVRASVITVIPLAALAQLGSIQRVSVLFFGVSLLGLVGSLAIPSLVHHLNRRGVVTLGVLLAVGGAAAMATGTLAGLIAGMVLNILSIAALEVTLNLYVLDHIPRKELGAFEPLRVFFAAAMWTAGPWFGVWLSENVSPQAPYAFMAATAIVTLVYFWFLHLTDSPAVALARKPAPNPLHYLPRFFAQPRLRLAWLLAIGRSAWWSMFFIYAPIYVVTSGLGGEWAGAIVSLGTASFFLVPAWSRLGRRYGLRWLLVAGYAATGVATILVAAAMGGAWLGVITLLLAAAAAGIVDAAGNIPFLRAVHPHERPEMTTVHNTFRGVAQTVPPGIFAVLLKLFELPAIFVASGAAMLTLAWFCRYLPKRL